MKKAFSLLEVILMILLLGFLYTAFIPKTQINRIDELTNRLVLYLKQTRYQSLVNDKYNVPKDEANTDYQEILAWVADGNTIAEAD